MTLSKALGGIGYPISAIAYDAELDGWKQGAHIGTFRGHQVAMAAGLAAIDFMQEVDLPSHAAILGELTLSLLRDEQDGLPSVGDVRGRGLMIGIELVKDRDTKEPWPEMAAQVRTECFRRGVIIEVGGHFGNVARFLPPLVITRELLLRGVEIFVDSVREAEQALARPSALIAS
jgi:diaminobutyrate-2-oxoglutarate transaminase